MKIHMRLGGLYGLFVGVSVGLLVGVMGCDLESSDVSRVSSVRVAGRYTGPNGARLVANNSGAAVFRLDLQQRGDRLHGVDNNGVAYEGRLRTVEPDVASFRLDGRTTVGRPFTLTGSIEVTGTRANLHGTWVESDLRSGVFGTASVTLQPDPDPDPPPTN